MSLGGGLVILRTTFCWKASSGRFGGYGGRSRRWPVLACWNHLIIVAIPMSLGLADEQAGGWMSRFAGTAAEPFVDRGPAQA